MPATDTHLTIEAVWRIESAKLIASLARFVRDVGLAEEMAQEALVGALEQWPKSGLPENPAAWLMTVAKRRAIDFLRRQGKRDEKLAELGRRLEESHELGPGPDEEFGDDMLRLIFTACHPVLSKEYQVALTLRMLGGLTTEEIARAFLVKEATIAQRIVRAKRALADAEVPFEVPHQHELQGRLNSVLEAIYLIFNEGYAATSGGDWIRPQLGEDALRLGRILAGLLPNEPEVRGLVALMELQASRFKARVGPSGEPILLADQDRSRWDRLLIGRGLAALEEAERLSFSRGAYTIQAAIAACHARARSLAETDWQRISALYDELTEVAPSAVVELNRAVAHAMAFGPEVGLQMIDELNSEPALERYYLLPSVRGDLLEKVGRKEEARREFERAASLTQNAREKELLLNRAGEMSA